MKKFITTLLASALVLCTLASCSDNGEPILFQDMTMGLVLQDLSFQADNGNIYHFDATDIEHYTPGNRLLIGCYATSVIPGKSNEFNAVMLTLVKPMERVCIARSGITDWEKIGDSPLNVEDGWVSGGYLNAKVAIRYWSPNDHNHTLDLVFDDTADNSQCLHFEMRHNNGGDEEEDIAYAYATFNIKDYIPAVKSEIDVELKWTWEDGDHLATFTITNK